MFSSNPAPAVLRLLGPEPRRLLLAQDPVVLFLALRRKLSGSGGILSRRFPFPLPFPLSDFGSANPEGPG